MTPTPTQAHEPVEVTQAALIDEIISMYHTTRLADTPVAQHILSKASVQKAFARFERHRQSSNAASVGVEARRLAVRTIIDVYNSARPASMSPVEFVLSKRVVQEALASLSTPTAEPEAG